MKKNLSIFALGILICQGGTFGLQAGLWSDFVSPVLEPISLAGSAIVCGVTPGAIRDYWGFRFAAGKRHNKTDNAPGESNESYKRTVALRVKNLHQATCAQNFRNNMYIVAINLFHSITSRLDARYEVKEDRLGRLDRLNNSLAGMKCGANAFKLSDKNRWLA